MISITNPGNLSKLGFTLSVTLLISICAYGGNDIDAIASIDDRDELRNYFNVLGGINSYNLLEGAGSHGSLGIHLGIGTKIVKINNNSNLVQQNLFPHNPSSQSPNSLFIPNLVLIKGLWIPVNVGLSYAKSAKMDFEQWSGFVQWSFFERFRWPSFALQAAYTRLFGLENSQINTFKSSLIGSFAFFRFFTVFAEYGLLYHMASVTPSQKTEGMFLIAKNQSLSSVEENWAAKYYSYGLKMTLIPTLVTAAFEISRTNPGDLKSYSAKLSVRF